MAINTNINTNTTQLIVPFGGSGIASTVSYAPICGGTTTTGALQSVASVGSSGQYLTSNGVGVLPSYQAFPSLGTSPLIYTKVTLSPSDITGMFASPKLLVAAGGANTLLVVIWAVLELNFNTTAYTLGGTTSIGYGTSATAAAASTLNATIIRNASSGFTVVRTRTSGLVTGTLSVNLGLYVKNITQAYATGDSTCYIHIYYSLLSTAI